MVLNRIPVVETQFHRFLRSWNSADASAFAANYVWRGPPELLKNLYVSQLISRLLDYESRRLKQSDHSFYTIGSAGHEGNAALGALLRKKDPCFLHYRSGALMAQKLAEEGRTHFIKMILRSLCCSAQDPVSGGRHKVWGSISHFVPPQTSTIASHLPKAVGTAFALERATALGETSKLDTDSIVCASFGDASVNHASALGAINTAKWIVHQKLKLPLLLVCEDNGLGISVKTPKHWIEDNFSQQKHLKYVCADACKLEEVWSAAEEAVSWVRQSRKPLFLHLRTVRLFGHAGSDVESNYLSEAEIEGQEERDPLFHSAKLLLSSGIETGASLQKQYFDLKVEISKLAEEIKGESKLSSAAAVMKYFNYPKSLPNASKNSANTLAAARLKAWSKEQNFPEKQSKKRHMAMLLNWALKDILATQPKALIFGEDVAKKGGVYHVTEGLSETFGTGRVFNTLLDEQSILGLAMGFGHLGFIPMPEIQYLAYYHNAQDQIRSEAASLQFFSNGQYSNSMVIRIASFAYQKGFGGHFHNDNSIAVLLDIPGAVVVAPSRGDDAVKLLRLSLQIAEAWGRQVFFLEPIALYMTKDLYQKDDGLWSDAYPSLEEECAKELGKPRCYFEGDKYKVLVLSFANGVYMSLRAIEQSQRLRSAKVPLQLMDLRWLKPLPETEILDEAKKAQRVLIVDECRKGGGIAEELLCLLTQKGKLREDQVYIIQAQDSYIPLGPAASTVLPEEKDILLALDHLIDK